MTFAVVDDLAMVVVPRSDSVTALLDARAEPFAQTAGGNGSAGCDGGLISRIIVIVIATDTNDL
jgi:hypothetical protein